MLRCCYVTGHGWGGGGILTFMYLAYIRGCYAAAANFWNTWKTSCRRIDAVRWGKKEANPGIDKVVTSFSKIVSLRRKRHFANFPMEFSHKKCIHLKLEKSPYKRTENQCWMILNLPFWATAVYAPGFLVCTKTDQPKDVTFLRPWFCASCSTPPNPMGFIIVLSIQKQWNGVYSVAGQTQRVSFQCFFLVISNDRPPTTSSSYRSEAPHCLISENSLKVAPPVLSWYFNPIYNSCIPHPAVDQVLGQLRNSYISNWFGGPINLLIGTWSTNLTIYW